MSERGSEVVFDAEGFYSALDAVRAENEMTWRDVAREARVSPSTLTRLGQGRRPDVDSMARLISWAGLDTDDFIRGSRPQPTENVLARLPAYLRADPNLSEESARSLEAIIKAAYEEFREKT